MKATSATEAQKTYMQQHKINAAIAMPYDALSLESSPFWLRGEWAEEIEEDGT